MLLAFQWAFPHSVNLPAAHRADGPFAVAGSLLSFEAKPLSVWLTGFFSLGMVLVSYNIIETISTPKELPAGYWQVDMVANLQ
jgi:hypothetical protein